MERFGRLVVLFYFRISWGSYCCFLVVCLLFRAILGCSSNVVHGGILLKVVVIVYLFLFGVRSSMLL